MEESPYVIRHDQHCYNIEDTEEHHVILLQLIAQPTYVAHERIEHEKYNNRADALNQVNAWAAKYAGQVVIETNNY